MPQWQIIWKDNMNERPKLISLEEILQKYPGQDYYSQAKDSETQEIKPVFSRVRINEENQIVYVEPKSVRFIDATEIPKDAVVHKLTRKI